MSKEIFMIIFLIVFVLLFLFEIINKLDFKDVFIDTWEALKIPKKNKNIISKFRILYYFIFPLIASIVITQYIDEKDLNEFIPTLLTVLTFLIGFLINSIFSVNGLMEKVKNNEDKKEALLILHNSIVYEILLSILLFFVSILLYFIKYKILICILFFLSLHTSIFFIFLFYIITGVLKIDL